jgi:hypothetical protein
MNDNESEGDRLAITAFLDGRSALDGRPRLAVPAPSDELTPIMERIDECLLTDEAEPPMRSSDGWPVEIRAHEAAGLHWLTDADDKDVTRLPPARILTLAQHDRWSLAFMIERYVSFFKRTPSKKDKSGGVEAPCALPPKFVTAYLKFSASRLPRVSALATAPLVLPNGRILATNGLDREQGVVFRIPDQIAEAAPKGRVTKAAVAHAMRFLTDEWLIDVKADYGSKCVLVALALTIIERPVFAERPAFFVTSGKSASGKTTAINMVSLAATGKRAPAAAWSRLEEERRKAIFAAFLQGVPLIAFDNIARGATISCPVVEKVLTADEMEDRVLGESRDAASPAKRL